MRLILQVDNSTAMVAKETSLAEKKKKKADHLEANQVKKNMVS